MAATVFVKKTVNLTGDKIVLADITLDASYPTGGYNITPASLGFNQIDMVVASVPPLGGVVPVFNGSQAATPNMLQAFWSTTGAGIAMVEVTAATNLATTVVSVMAIGS